MPLPIRVNAERSRFELEADGVPAVMNYRINRDVISLDHTEIPVAYPALVHLPEEAN